MYTFPGQEQGAPIFQGHGYPPLIDQITQLVSPLFTGQVTQPLHQDWQQIDAFSLQLYADADSVAILLRCQWLEFAVPELRAGQTVGEIIANSDLPARRFKLRQEA